MRNFLLTQKKLKFPHSQQQRVEKIAVQASAILEMISFSHNIQYTVYTHSIHYERRKKNLGFGPVVDAKGVLCGVLMCSILNALRLNFKLKAQFSFFPSDS